MIVEYDNIFHKYIYSQILITVYGPQTCVHYITHGMQERKKEREKIY